MNSASKQFDFCIKTISSIFIPCFPKVVVFPQKAFPQTLLYITINIIATHIRLVKYSAFFKQFCVNILCKSQHFENEKNVGPCQTKSRFLRYQSEIHAKKTTKNYVKRRNRTFTCAYRKKNRRIFRAGGLSDSWWR